MKVSQLIQELSALDPDLEVIVSKDEEGNGFELLADVEVSMCHRDRFGDIEPVHPDDEDSYDEGELQPCVVLWP